MFTCALKACTSRSLRWAISNKHTHTHTHTSTHAHMNVYKRHTHSTQVDCWLLLVREYIQQFMIALANNTQCIADPINAHIVLHIRDPDMSVLMASFCATIFQHCLH